jgi:putative DNA primase/helicase
MKAEEFYAVPNIEELAADLNNGAAQGSTSEADPIQIILKDSGLAALQPGASMATVEMGVRDLVACLAGADDIRRVTVREAAFKVLEGIGVKAPGRLLDAALERPQAAAMAEPAIFFADPEPWPDEIAGAELLDGIAEVLRQFVVMSIHARRATALWILHAWALAAFDISALLAIISATKRSGKTTLLELVGMLVPRGLSASNITAPALFRSIETFKPTLLIDEADTFVRENDELRGVLNAGHRRSSAFVIRTVGDEHEPKHFCTWGAKAIALIGKLPGTLEDRSILIEMRRRAPSEKISRFRSRAVKELCEPLRRQAARWANDALEALKKLEPEPPEGLNDRAADNWLPLIAIADHCGGRWPEQAREAAKALCALSDESEDSAVVDLLQELKTIFSERDRISSADLAERLGGQSEKRWADWRRGKPITQRQVARLLAPLKIKPSSIRIGDETPRGYLREWFNDPFARYLPDLIRNSATNEENQEVTKKIDPQQNGHVADQKSSLSGENLTNVADVADRKAELRSMDPWDDHV